MIYHTDLTKILFLDIETVHQTAFLEHLSEPHQLAWKHKAKSILKLDSIDDETAAACYRDKAGIFRAGSKN